MSLHLHLQPQVLNDEIGNRRLPATLTVPDAASGIVVFADANGSSRFSPRNQSVARHLQSLGLATLLFDLLTEREAADGRNIHDTALLAERLNSGMNWVGDHPTSRDLPLGLFGIGTGAAAALVTAARVKECVAAVVSLEGRPDLAHQYVSRVKAPTLLIVGGKDRSLIEPNQRALDLFACEAMMEVIVGAKHPFSKREVMMQVAALAGQWFEDHLSSYPDPSDAAFFPAKG